MIFCFFCILSIFYVFNFYVFSFYKKKVLPLHYEYSRF